ncbi:hypothetical protein TWF694_011188 [Orbilia ellipsospora]|uniref:Deoxyribonuclease NucA/NucB domain-containing protein n=1 Tax=Orbilia ellipsospora TaxID=2528407 RepID=A0AAV9XEM5_9PEZI
MGADIRLSRGARVLLVIISVCFLAYPVDALSYELRSAKKPSGSKKHAGSFTNHSMALLSGSFKSSGGSFSPSLFKRQEETCTLPSPWIPCGPFNCCSATDAVCAGGICVCCPKEATQCCAVNGECCPSNSNCYLTGCCPKTAETCGKGFCLAKGQTCCADGACDVDAECVTSPGGTETCCSAGEAACDDGSCCEEGYECTTSPSGAQGCCKPGYYPCDDGIHCCVDGTTCGELYCEKPVTTTPFRTTTKKKTTTTSTTTTTTSRLKLTTTTTTSTTTTKKKTTTSSATQCSPTKNLSTDAADAGDYMQVNGECLPVFDFPVVQGLTEQACETICNGIASQAWAGKIDDSSMVLTKRNGRLQTPNCPGSCPGTTDAVYGVSTQCDEFPFGSTLEGGTSAAYTNCIAWWQNNVGGVMIRQYVAFYNIQPNDKFVVRVTPSCAYLSQLGSQSPSRREIVARQSDQPRNSTVGGNSVLSNTFSGWYKNPIGSDGEGFVLSPLGTVNGGIYSTEVRLTGDASNIYVIDGDGVEYAGTGTTGTSISQSSKYTLNFTLPSGDDLTLVAPAMENANVAMSYTATVQPLPSDSSVPSGAEGIRASFMRGLRTLYLVEIAVAAFFLLF